MPPRIVLALLSLGMLLAQPASDPAGAARRALDLFLARNYGDLQQMFAPELGRALPAEKLKAVGDQIQSLGAVQKISEPTVQAAGANSVVVIPIKFASAEIAFQTAVDPQGKIAGFFLRALPPPAPPWNPPAYSKVDSFHERQVAIGSEPWKLPGTLTIPNGSGRFPGVALVQGSGPQDRDETVGANKPFRDLAEGLASRGIVVLRYEKRTKEYQSRMAGLAHLTVQEEAVEDAVKAAALVREQAEVDPKRVYVLGHSLGGYLAPRIARQDAKLAGLVILAGSVRPMEDLMVEQVEYLNPAGAPNIRAQAERIKALDPGDEDAPPILGIPPSYWLDLKEYDPAALAKTLSVPMLILQGERDYQVTMKDFALWKAALGSRKDATFKSFPALNHLFMAGEGKSLPAEYQQPGHVAEEVIGAIASFMGR